MLSRLAVVLLCAVMVSGCAYTVASELEPHEPANGFKYYECKPLVVVSNAGVDIKYVPNPSKAYAVRFGTFLAKNKVVLKFRQGCGIESIESDQDSTAAIGLIQSVLDKLAPNAVAPTKTGGSAAAVRIEIYDIVFDNNGNILGLKRLLGKTLPAAVDG